MLLSDIFDHLGHGELSQLAVAGSAEPYGENSGIREADRPQILSHIELGLTALYKRFPFVARRVTVTLVAERVSYVLHSDFLVGNALSAEPVRYLVASILEPFDDTILKIDDVRAVFPVTGPASGSAPRVDQALVLNDPADPYAIRTPTATSLILPTPLIARLATHAVTQLEVHYRARHPKINRTSALAAPFATVIELPESHLEALLYFVASRMMNPVGMMDEFHAGNSYYAKYEAECARLEMQNLTVDTWGEENRFRARGFV